MKAAAPIQRTRREREGGFALLLVFMFAAAVAFAIYQELPRAAFESARDKEQLLMDRGKQYERAIEVYYAENKRYPPELKDLEDTNRKRYLRRRYKDPLTGQDEWRLIHTNGSFLTDSMVKKPPEQNAGSGAPGGSTVGGGPLGSNTMNTVSTPAASATPNAAPAVNAAAQRRPSDRTLAPEGTPQSVNPQTANPFGAGPGNIDPNDPRTWPPITLATPNAQPGQTNALRPGPQSNMQIMAGQIGAGQVAPGQNNFGQQLPMGQQFPPPIQQQINGAPADPNQTQLAVPGLLNPNMVNTNQQNQFGPNQQNQFNPNQPNPLNAFNQNQGGVNQGGQVVPQGNQFPQPMPGGGQQPPPVGGLNGGNGGNAALQAINDQIFRPNQGGAPLAGAVATPGIAGVASKHEGPSIKAYRERTKYQEWEFVFDASIKSAIQPAGLGQNQLGQNPPGQGQLGQGQTGPGQSQPGTGQGQMGSGQPQAQPGIVNPFSQPNPFSPQNATPGTPPR